MNKPFIVGYRWEFNIARWDHVIVIPDDNNIIVFNNGNAHGSNEDIPTGGQLSPVWTQEFIIIWKKAQKKEKKNIISLTINKHIPSLIPFWTLIVWYPS